MKNRGAAVVGRRLSLSAIARGVSHSHVPRLIDAMGLTGFESRLRDKNIAVVQRVKAAAILGVQGAAVINAEFGQQRAAKP